MIIGLVVDTPNWAYANIAKQIKKHTSQRLVIRVFALSDFDNNPAKALIALENCDLIHFFWREAVRTLDHPFVQNYIASLGITYEEFLARFWFSKKITASVYDHLFSSTVELKRRFDLFGSLSAYTVSSQKLEEIYGGLDGLKPPKRVIQDGVDLNLFRHTYRQYPLERPIRVGWVGNSDWGNGSDHKGLHTIIKPALNYLNSSSRGRFEGVFADRKLAHIPMAKMPDYYSGIDVLVCASKSEGTPNPVLEAMASGLPVITTDVGVVREVFGPHQQEFILETRSADCLSSKLDDLFASRTTLKTLANENLEQIRSWDWPMKVKKFEDFFLETIGN